MKVLSLSLSHSKCISLSLSKCEANWQNHGDHWLKVHFAPSLSLKVFLSFSHSKCFLPKNKPRLCANNENLQWTFQNLCLFSTCFNHVFGKFLPTFFVTICNYFRTFSNYCLLWNYFWTNFWTILIQISFNKKTLFFESQQKLTK